ncbi:MAG: rod shape-determining protein MreD [Alphaproteobacteria bacterium]|nr:rod shape-determining protein MreD [Alphaproteobacteria bacterium]
MRPYLTWMDRFEFVWRAAMPYGLMTLLFILNVISVPYPLSILFKAPFFLMAVYYWSIYRPALVPPWMVFLSGLLLDLLSGLPLGLNALLFVLCRWAAVDQRRYLTSQNFFIVWIGFAFLNVAYVLAQWFVFLLVYRHFYPFSEIGFSLALGTALFPAIYIFMHLSHKLLQPVS